MEPLKRFFKEGSRGCCSFTSFGFWGPSRKPKIARCLDILIRNEDTDV